MVGLVHKTLVLQLKANIHLHFTCPYCTCDSLWCPLPCDSVASSDSLCPCIPFEKCRHQGIELLKWDTAHPTVRSSSPEVSWCSCFIQWVNTGHVSSFGLFIFMIFWFRRAASSARLRVICLHSHQQMESEKFCLFLQAPLKVLHLLNQIWYYLISSTF